VTRALVNVPKTARRGEVIEIKAMIAHPMETGYRIDHTGAPIPRSIINRFVCTYAGEEVFAAELFPAVSANPFLSFFTVATVSGTIGFAWTDDDGGTQIASAEIEVT
jgi:sulfur-oxidizing protein SoxZ